MNLRDQILSADDLPRVPLVVPEWGGVTVYVRTLSGTERDAFEASGMKGAGKKATPNLANFRARLAVLTLVDETGKRLFSDDDAVVLGRKSGAALDRVADLALSVNRFKAEDVEEAEKN